MKRKVSIEQAQKLLNKASERTYSVDETRMVLEHLELLAKLQVDSFLEAQRLKQFEDMKQQKQKKLK